MGMCLYGVWGGQRGQGVCSSVTGHLYGTCKVLASALQMEGERKKEEKGKGTKGGREEGEREIELQIDRTAR